MGKMTAEYQPVINIPNLEIKAPDVHISPIIDLPMSRIAIVMFSSSFLGVLIGALIIKWIAG